MEGSLMILNPLGTSEAQMAKRRNKSDSYQYKIVEISVDPVIMNEFPLVESLGSQLHLAKHSEKFDELRDQLMQEVVRLINTKLTPRQSEVVTLRLQGKTQIQIADELGIHQTTVHKLLMGNIDYANGRKRYGGAIKKLKKLCAKDEVVQDILSELDNLRAADPLDDPLDVDNKSRWDEGFDD
jgi:DNA-binding CsgD family transcriptional regulator